MAVNRDRASYQPADSTGLRQSNCKPAQGCLVDTSVTNWLVEPLAGFLLYTSRTINFV